MKSARHWWRPRNLLLAWCAYWVALLLITLGPAIRAGWRMAQVPNSHGTVAVSLTDGVFLGTIGESGRTTWSGSVSLLTLALLVAIPPLLLWLVWLIGTSRTNNAGSSAANQVGRQQLYATDSRTEFNESSPSRRRAREES
jgi:hypothetical protein